jgi:FtsH-binding integral membrane protein
VLVGFLGIAFQIRSYLYSGLIFTLFAVVAMVAHAQQSVQHTWPWWVLGISLGIGIMVLFGMFERKRHQLMKLSERLKSWEG